MARRIDLSLLGDKRLERQLKRLPVIAQRKVVRRAMREAARPVQAEAERLAPRGETGRMAATIKIKAAKGKAGLGVVVQTGTREELGIAADDPYYYPFAVEYGHGDVPAHPFMRPAMDNMRPTAMAIVARVVRERLPIEAARIK